MRVEGNGRSGLTFPGLRSAPASFWPRPHVAGDPQRRPRDKRPLGARARLLPAPPCCALAWEGTAPQRGCVRGCVCVCMSVPLRGLEGVPGLPGAPQDEAGLTRKFETSHVGGAPAFDLSQYQGLFQ